MLALASVAMADGGPKAPERKNWDSYTYGPLYGDVASLSIRLYSAKDSFGEMVKDGFYYYRTYKFNTKGDVTEECYRNEDGSIIWKDVYQYDANGNTTAYTEYRSDGSLYGKSTWKYSPEGLLLDNTRYDGDGTISYKYVYEYDAAGNEVKCSRYGENYTLREVTKRKYEGNNQTELAVYNGAGELQSMSKRQYNDDGNVTLEASYGVGGALQDKYVTTYNEKGLRYSVKRYNADGLAWEDFYYYDEAGNCIKYFEFLADGSVSAKSYYTYDENNYRTSYLKYDKDENVIDHVEYSYDQQGRQTKYVSYDSAGTMNAYGTRTYQGQSEDLREQCEYNAEGTLVLKSIYSEVGGQILESVRYDNFGQMTSREVYTYQPDGAIKDYYYYTKGNKLESYSTRDKWGNLTGTYYTWDGGEYRQELEYDSKGYLIKWTSYVGHETAYTYIYHNDAHGNIVTSESYYSDILVPQHIFERQTTYR